MKNVINLIFILIYKISFEIVTCIYYKNYYRDFNLNIHKLLISYISIIILGLYIPKNEKKLSNIYTYFLYMMMLIPISSYYYLTNNSTYFYILCYISFFVISFLIRKRISFHLEKIKLKHQKLSIIEKIIKNKILIIFLISFIFLLLIKEVRFPTLEVFNLQNVYKLRAEKGTVGIISDLEALLKEILIFIFVVGSLKYKIFSYGLITILFMINPHKSIMFIPILGLILYIFYKYKLTIKIINIGLCSLTASALILGKYFYRNIYSLLIRRILLVPAQLNFIYYDFINSGKGEYIYYFRETIKKLFNIEISNFSGSYSKRIGELYFHVGNNANNGFLASEYIRSGWIGIIIVSILISLTFLYVDYLGKKIEKEKLNALFFLMTFNLISDSYLGTMKNFILLKLIFCTFIFLRSSDKNAK